MEIKNTIYTFVKDGQKICLMFVFNGAVRTPTIKTKKPDIAIRLSVDFVIYTRLRSGNPQPVAYHI